MKVDFRGKTVLAPIAGYSDVGLRRVCAERGADMTYTEMISAEISCIDAFSLSE